MQLGLGGRTSLTVRLTVLFVAASTTVLLILGYLVASSVDQHFEEQDMSVLSGKPQERTLEVVDFLVQKELIELAAVKK